MATETTYNQPSEPNNPMPYEQAREQLIEVVRQLEAGNVSLTETMDLWKRGEELAKICQDWLDGAMAKVNEKFSQDPDIG